MPPATIVIAVAIELNSRTKLDRLDAEVVRLADREVAPPAEEEGDLGPRFIGDGRRAGSGDDVDEAVAAVDRLERDEALVAVAAPAEHARLGPRLDDADDAVPPVADHD